MNSNLKYYLKDEDNINNYEKLLRNHFDEIFLIYVREFLCNVKFIIKTFKSDLNNTL